VTPGLIRWAWWLAGVTIAVLFAAGLLALALLLNGGTR